MKGKTSGISIVAASVWLCTTFMPAPAQTSAEAIQLYKDGKYGPALKAFEAVDQKEPKNAMTHYYIALCCQGMNQTARALAEYQWVADNCNNKALKAAALKGIDSVSRYKTARDSQVRASAANAEAAAAKKAGADKTAATSTDKPGEKPGDKTAAAKPGDKNAKPGAKTADTNLRCKKVLVFAQPWDRVFMSFGPSLDAAKDRFKGKVSISTVDPDDESSSGLKTKYNVSTYPTFVYLDAGGNIIKSDSSCPSDADSFASEIEGCNSKK